MAVITSIKPNRGARGRVSVFLDGRFFCSMLESIAEQHGLQEGGEVEIEDLHLLQEVDAYAQALDAAVRYLSYRPRSEREVRMRLRRGNFAPEHVERVLETLRRYGYVDDAGFARYWKEARDQFSPRGSRLVAMELRQKGIDRDVIEDVVDDEQDDEHAYTAARKKAQQLRALPYPDFRQRLGSYLARRGFDYDVISDVVQRLWREREGSAEDVEAE
ncbi:MAG: hypothetical protein EPO21_21580 [Chloroflexota bacterium]|nr:MAG: hypothetical protein EPO21_21580 [Chloroflexota bacterium]